jgi:hypothetical protein
MLNEAITNPVFIGNAVTTRRPQNSKSRNGNIHNLRKQDKRGTLGHFLPVWVTTESRTLEKIHKLVFFLSADPLVDR